MSLQDVQIGAIKEEFVQPPMKGAIAFVIWVLLAKIAVKGCVLLILTLLDWKQLLVAEQ